MYIYREREREKEEEKEKESVRVKVSYSYRQIYTVLILKQIRCAKFQHPQWGLGKMVVVLQIADDNFESISILFVKVIYLDFNHIKVCSCGSDRQKVRKG